MEYDEISGLPQPYVYSLVQGPTGHLWIGTGEGLGRFDGKSFDAFTVSDSLCDNFVVTSHTNENGVWFGHMNGGVSLYDGYTFQKMVNGDQGTGTVTDIKTQGNTTWVSTQSGGFWRIDADQEAKLYQDSLQELFVFAFELLSSTECLVGSLDGVYLYSMDQEAQRLRMVSPLEGLPETKIQDMALSQDKETLYILTLDEGIYLFNTRDLSMKAEALGLDLEAEIEGPQQIFEDSDRNLWIPTFGSGLYKLIRNENGDFTSWLNFNESSGLPGDNVKYVMEDREQNIWLGMFGTGLVRLVDESFTYYYLEGSIQDNSIHSMYVNSDFAWMGTENGVIRLDRQSGTIEEYSGSEFGLPPDRVTAISGSAGDELWVGTRGKGVFRWDAGSERFSSLTISQGVLENYINALEWQNDTLWIATGKGVCKLNTTNMKADWFTISSGIPHNSVNRLWIDSTGRVWLSTISSSLCYIKDNKVERIDLPGLESSINISGICVDSEGFASVGTSGSGVWIFDGDSLLNLTSEDGLVSDYCLSVMSDESGKVWISHRHGLSRISLDEGRIKNFKEDVGIENMEFNLNASYKEPSGVLWFGSSNGILSYNPAMQKDEAPAPALSLTGISVNGEEEDLRSDLRLASGRYDLRIEYMGINMKNPAGVSYSYQMEGLGDDWSAPLQDSYVLFNKLPDGKYTFRLRSMNSEGVVNQVPLSFNILIEKPIWKRWWFYILDVVVLLALIAAYIQRREQQLRLQTMKLEQAVQARTEEVVMQKKEIEEQHDAIKEQNERIRLINTNMTDSITYARRIQRAVFPPEEHLGRLFRESFVMNRPKDIVSGDFFWMANKKGKKVISVADCTGHGVPGAFMSMLGITLLNDLVNTRNILEPDTILNLLKNEIIRALRQKGKSDEATDGMDMALCVYDTAEAKLQYAGGFNPLVLVRDGEITRIKADPMPIGIGAITGREFTRHELEVRKGDVIYLYSDGYEDQFGGEKNKKFSRKRFRELLLNIHTLTMPEQKRTLESTLDEWMEGVEQIDDITVLGIRF